MDEKIKIVVVDDHKIFLEGLVALLQDEERISIVGFALNGIDALEQLKKYKVDVLITDISMPDMDGIELVKKAGKIYSHLKTLVLSTHNDAEMIGELIKWGANGYLLKNAEKEELLNAIHSIASGVNYFAEEVKKEFLDKTFSSQKAKEEIPRLSKRELEILKLIVSEHTTGEMAEKLFISQNTVNTHRKNLLAKLKVKNTAGLVKYAVQQGLI